MAEAGRIERRDPAARWPGIAVISPEEENLCPASSCGARI